MFRFAVVSSFCPTDGASLSMQLKESRREADRFNPDVAERARTAHLQNLNEDPMLSGVVFHMLSDEQTTLGRKEADPAPNVMLSGLR